jgi:hypothetical protein
MDDGSKIARRHNDADTKKSDPQLTASASAISVVADVVADSRLFLFARYAEVEIDGQDD